MVKLYEHPTFVKCRKDWQVYYDFQEGCKEVLLARYLVDHIIETGTTEICQKIKKIRHARTEYTNVQEMVVSSYQSLFFKDDPDVSEVKGIFPEEEMNDVDGKGKSLLQFIKEDVLLAYLLYGKPIILTDANAVRAKNGLEESLLGQRPFWELLNPLNVPDWQVRGGQYSLLRYEYMKDEERTSLEEEPRQERYSKAYIQNGSSVVVRFYKRKSSDPKTDAEKASSSSDEWLIEGDVPIDIDQVPVATLWNQESWVKDIAPLCRRYYNLESNLDNVQLNQGHQRVFIATEMSAEEFMAVGEQVIGRIQQGDSVHQVEPADTSGLERRLAGTELAIYRIAFNSQRSTPADSKEIAAADSQREEKDPMVSLVQNAITELEDVVNLAVKHWAAFKGKKDYKGRIKFSKDITTEDIDQVSKIFLSHQSYINRFPTWKEEYFKKLAYSQNLGQMDKIIKEIENGDMYDPEEAMKEQMDMGGGGGFPPKPGAPKPPLKEKIKAAGDGKQEGA